MITIRKAGDRGHFNFGWLDTYHTFSFGEYYDQRQVGFGALRVINEDRVQPGYGFGTHPHRDMEIISYVLEGGLAHRDSMGHGSVIRPGEVQRLTAGTGITHSEANHSQTELVHFLQIWLLPEQRGLTPGYEQKFYAPEEKQGRLRLIASPDGRAGSVLIHQDAQLYAALLEPGQALSYQLAPTRQAWVQVARGSIKLNGQLLVQGDGAAVTAETALQLAGETPAEILLFDLA